MRDFIWLGSVVALLVVGCGGSSSGRTPPVGDAGAAGRPGASGGADAAGSSGTAGSFVGGAVGGGGGPGAAGSSVGGAGGGGEPRAGGSSAGGAAGGAGEPDAGGLSVGGGPAMGGSSVGGEPGDGGEPGAGGLPVGGEAGGGGGPGAGGSSVGGKPGGGGGPGAGGSAVGGEAGGGGPGAGGGGPLPSGCVLADQLDDCCSAPIPVSAEQLAADPCLAAHPSLNLDPARVALCPGAIDGTMVNCVRAEPPSRGVAENAAGECVFVDECLMADDCVVATDHHRCCSCPEVFPAALVASDPCVSLTYVGPEAGCADCSAVDCAGCPAIQPLPSCGDAPAGYRTCR